MLWATLPRPAGEDRISIRNASCVLEILGEGADLSGVLQALHTFYSQALFDLLLLHKGSIEDRVFIFITFRFLLFFTG